MWWLTSAPPRAPASECGGSWVDCDSQGWQSERRPSVCDSQSWQDVDDDASSWASVRHEPNWLTGGDLVDMVSDLGSVATVSDDDEEEEDDDVSVSTRRGWPRVGAGGPARGPAGLAMTFRQALAKPVVRPAPAAPVVAAAPPPRAPTPWAAARAPRRGCRAPGGRLLLPPRGPRRARVAFEPEPAAPRALAAVVEDSDESDDDDMAVSDADDDADDLAVPARALARAQVARP